MNGKGCADLGSVRQKTDELKPCPFCGAKAGLWRTYEGFFVVQCSRGSCSMTTMHKPFRNLVVEAWNRRVEDGKAD